MSDQFAFTLPNNILEEWPTLSTGQTKFFVKNFNEKDIVIFVDKKISHTKFTIRAVLHGSESMRKGPGNDGTDSETIQLQDLAQAFDKDPVCEQAPLNYIPKRRESGSKRASEKVHQEDPPVKRSRRLTNKIIDPPVSKVKSKAEDMNKSKTSQMTNTSCRKRTRTTKLKRDEKAAGLNVGTHEDDISASKTSRLPSPGVPVGIKTRLRTPGRSPLVALMMKPKSSSKAQNSRNLRLKQNKTRNMAHDPSPEDLDMPLRDTKQAEISNHDSKRREPTQKKKLWRKLNEVPQKELEENAVDKNIDKNSPSNDSKQKYETGVANLEISVKEGVESEGTLSNMASSSKEPLEDLEQYDSSTQCNICNSEFISHKMLITHIKQTHKMTWVDYITILTLPTEVKQRRIFEILNDAINQISPSSEEEKSSSTEEVLEPSNDATGSPLEKVHKRPRQPKAIKDYVTKVDFEMTDATLSSMQEGDNSCLLCGCSFTKRTKLCNHLYFCHKITFSAQNQVLKSTDLDLRRTALNSLKQTSKEQMILSGKHCPICHIGMVNANNLLGHMTTHAAHPEYLKYLRTLKHNMEISKRYSKLSNLHSTKRLKAKQTLNGLDEIKTETKDTDKTRLSVFCCICFHEFRNGNQLRRHLNSLHLISWIDYISLDTLPNKLKEQKIKEILEKRKLRYKRTITDDVSVDYSHQIINCVQCQESVLCEAYKQHLETEHTELDNSDQVIEEMDRVLLNSMALCQNRASILCPYCETNFSRAQISRHMKLSHSKEEDYAVKLERLETDVKCMMNKIRSQSRAARVALKIRLICRFCDMTFIDQSTRSFHENYSCVNNEKRKKKYSCKFCGRRGTNEAWYTEHIKQHNPNGPNYICQQCGNGYMNKSGLDAHKAKDHMNVKRYTCELCGKEFYVSSHFKSHMLKHSVERGHACTICTKKFKTHGCLQRHIRTIHLNQYRYKCSVCGHGVEKEDALKSHRCTSVRRKTVQKSDLRTNTSLLNLSTFKPASADSMLQTVKHEILPEHIPDGEPDAMTSSTELIDTLLVAAGESGIISQAIQQYEVVGSQGTEQVQPSGAVPVNQNILQNTTTGMIEHTIFLEPIDIKSEHNPASNMESLLPTALQPNIMQIEDNYDHNTRLQYKVDNSSEVLPSDGKKIQYVEEIYVDEAGHIITRQQEVSRIEQIIEAAELQETQNLIIVNENGEQTVGDTVVELPSFIWMNTEEETQ